MLSPHSNQIQISKIMGILRCKFSEASFDADTKNARALNDKTTIVPTTFCNAYFVFVSAPCVAIQPLVHFAQIWWGK